MAVFRAETPPLPPDALEIKVQPDDAFLGPAPGKESERLAGRPTSFFGRFLSFCARAVVLACLFALAWAGGAYYSSGHSRFDLHSPFGLLKLSRASDVEQTAERDQMLSQMRDMADEIRALKASVDAQDAARGNQESQKAQPDAAQVATGAAITALAGQVDRLEAELTSKLSQVNDQLANIEKQITASHAAVAARAATHKHVEHHDAFDPNQHPTAVGTPRPLGAAQ